jgi:hypothetical protein
MIQNKSYLMQNNQILTNKLLFSYINKFWNDVFSPIIKGGDEYHLMILCKVQYPDNTTYKTIGPLRKVEFKDKDLFYEYLTERLGLLTESYNQQQFNQIIFTYIAKKGGITESDRLLLQDLSDKKLPFHEFNKIKLPVSIIPEDFGEIIGIDKSNSEFTRFFVINGTKTFQIDKYSMMNKVKMLGAINLSWTDTLLQDGSISREIGKSTIIFLDGEIILQKKELNFKSFRRLRSK